VAGTTSPDRVTRSSGVPTATQWRSADTTDGRSPAAPVVPVRVFVVLIGFPRKRACHRILARIFVDAWASTLFNSENGGVLSSKNDEVVARSEPLSRSGGSVSSRRRGQQRLCRVSRGRVRILTRYERYESTESGSREFSVRARGP
jgi:hypothetical protein